MSLTFEDARQAVDAAVRPSWTPEAGTFVVSAYGWEDEGHWRIEAGAREYLVDGDAGFMEMNAPAYLVDKATGALERLAVIPNFDRIGAMRRVGRHPASD